jgi:hypothetical protein
MSFKTGDDVSQAIAVGQLTKAETKKLMPAAKASNTFVPTILFYASRELGTIDQFHQLGEYVLSLVHAYFV